MEHVEMTWKWALAGWLPKAPAGLFLLGRKHSFLKGRSGLIVLGLDLAPQALASGREAEAWEQRG